MSVFVVGFQEKIPSDTIIVNTTSRSNNWSKGLSPFFVGPVELYDSMTSKNVENAWQFSKLYSEYATEDGFPDHRYWLWAMSGWEDTYAHRYPMGKDEIPLCSWWNGERLSYIEARKRIYIPLYAKAVRKTSAFKQLETLLQQEKDVYLQDFDGYNHKKLNMSYSDVMNCESRKMGHGFVLAMMLEKLLTDSGELKS